ncbi:MAG TPA: hypothetical protein VLA68_01475 [Nitrososphaera sp.]|nr:hypothetical protein [Nitrososphaera sp.]
MVPSETKNSIVFGNLGMTLEYLESTMLAAAKSASVEKDNT